MQQQWIHISGVAGRTTSNVAAMYKAMGYFVTGSDQNCLPPATDNLDRNEIPYVQGHSYQHLTREFWERQLGEKLPVKDVPDRVIMVANLSRKNKEYMFAKVRNIPVQTYAQALGDDLVKGESIVTVGTAGKSTTSALFIHIMNRLGFDPSYMTGVEFADGQPAIANTNSEWSVMEGDEFYGTELEPHSKFFEYSPKYLLLNRISWDHRDVFPTESEYIENFANLLQQMPADGLVMANAADKNIREIASKATCQLKWFAAFDAVPEFINDDGRKLYWWLERGSGGSFVAHTYHQPDFSFNFTTPLVGDYNHQNLLGVIAMLYELFADNIDWDLVRQAIVDFPGLHKRLEILHHSEQVVIVDDLGGPTVKVVAGLDALDTKYSEYYKTVIYEPNTGTRTKSAVDSYAGVFDQVDELIIPTLSEYDDDLLSASELVSELKQLGLANVSHVESEKLVDYLLDKLRANDGQPDDTLGSHDIPESQRPQLIIFFSPFRLTSLARELVSNL